MSKREECSGKKKGGEEGHRHRDAWGRAGRLYEGRAWGNIKDGVKIDAAAMLMAGWMQQAEDD